MRQLPMISRLFLHFTMKIKKVIVLCFILKSEFCEKLFYNW